MIESARGSTEAMYHDERLTCASVVLLSLASLSPRSAVAIDQPYAVLRIPHPRLIFPEANALTMQFVSYLPDACPHMLPYLTSVT
jgi:hypothetical protein